jgi:hypothetical protein
VPTTSGWALPYPVNGDAANGPAQIQALAEAVDTDLTTLSNRTLARHVALGRSAAQSINNNTLTDISWTVEDTDASGLVTVPVTNITIPATAVWLLTSTILWATNATGYRAAQIIHVGTTEVLADYHVLSSGGSNVTGASMVTARLLTSGDQVKVAGLQTSGGALNVEHAYATFTMTRLPT